jgi:hypothetical protein
MGRKPDINIIDRSVALNAKRIAGE